MFGSVVWSIAIYSSFFVNSAVVVILFHCFLLLIFDHGNVSLWWFALLNPTQPSVVWHPFDLLFYLQFSHLLFVSVFELLFLFILFLFLEIFLSFLSIEDFSALGLPLLLTGRVSSCFHLLVVVISSLRPQALSGLPVDVLSLPSLSMIVGPHLFFWSAGGLLTNLARPIFYRTLKIKNPKTIGVANYEFFNCTVFNCTVIPSRGSHVLV